MSRVTAYCLLCCSLFDEVFCDYADLFDRFTERAMKFKTWQKKRPGHLKDAPAVLVPCSAYCTSTARLSLIFFCQMAGPVM
ncbi:hypothetical protein C7534_102169 [Pseudomonas sp. OV226]|jgi:hypothetical protein|nr:hypothetical protein C7534_102169 [Pseudomonas sp. OV226]